jgi:hypothetical protein
MGNVESLGSRSPINARGSLIHPENKRLFFRCAVLCLPPFGGRLCRWLDQCSLRYALLRDTKVRDE